MLLLQQQPKHLFFIAVPRKVNHKGSIYMDVKFAEKDPDGWIDIIELHPAHIIISINSVRYLFAKC